MTHPSQNADRPWEFHGLPEADMREFRRCLGQFGTGVTIITSTSGGRRVGVTANSFSSLSLDPPLILWSIRLASKSFDVFKSATHFAVNILAMDQIGLSQRFASSEDDKFAGASWESGLGDAPLIGRALAQLECELEQQIIAGDHAILVGRVRRFSYRNGEGLLFTQGRYRAAVDHPESVKQMDGTSGTTNQVDLSDTRSLYHFVYWAFHKMSESFEVYRNKAGLTLPQARTLIHVDERPKSTVEDIIKTRYLAPEVAEDAVVSLSERGLITRDGNGKISVTQLGIQWRQSLATHEAEFENEQVEGISRTDVAVTRRVLKHIIERNLLNHK